MTTGPQCEKSNNLHQVGLRLRDPTSGKLIDYIPKPISSNALYEDAVMIIARLFSPTRSIESVPTLTGCPYDPKAGPMTSHWDSHLVPQSWGMCTWDKRPLPCTSPHRNVQACSGAGCDAEGPLSRKPDSLVRLCQGKHPARCW